MFKPYFFHTVYAQGDVILTYVTHSPDPYIFLHFEIPPPVLLQFFADMPSLANAKLKKRYPIF